MVGGLLGVFTAPDGTAGTLARDAVPVYACPGDTEVGTLYRGDRVLVTGRNGDWLAVRNVRGAGERVFVLAATIIPDADLSALPNVDCDDVGTVAFDETTTTIPPTTTVPEVTTTTAAVTTTTAAPVTTTAPLPSVGLVSSAPNAISEAFQQDGSSCGGYEVTSLISASVTAPAGVQSVVMSWSSVVISPGSKPMTGQGGTYSAEFGPFTAEATPNFLTGSQVEVTVLVTVTDSWGRQATGHTTVTVHGCT